MLLDRPAVIVALLTPFREDGLPDEAALREHVDLLVEAGVHALMPCGSTGEGALLSDTELIEVVRGAAAASAGRVPVLAHVGRPGTLHTLELARRALDAGAEAISAVVPYYYPAAGDQIRAHYAALVDGLAGAPVYAYTIPANTHNELEPELLPRLIDDGLAGLKDSTKSLERHREYAAAARPAGDGFSLFDGSATLVLDALLAGSAGAVLAVANLHPELCVSLVSAFREGDGEEAQRLQRELSALERELAREAILPALKSAVAEKVTARGVPYNAALRSPLQAAATPMRTGPSA